MKCSKKVKSILILIIINIMFFSPITVNAQTLGEFKRNLNELRNQKDDSDNKIKEVRTKIASRSQEIRNAKQTITNNEKKVEDSKVLVSESQEQIKVKQEELKDVLIALQYTDSNKKEQYTDYIFQASSISEMIERQAVVEQVLNYTQESLENLDKLIVENQNLQTQLSNDNVNLNNSITDYEKQVDELQKYVDNQISVGLGYADQIKAQESLLKIYEQAGCKDGDDIDVCYYSKIGGSGSFSRPLNKGRISQAYGGSHKGIDLAVTEGTPVYSPASGTVIYVAYRTSCGGNIVYLHSLVDGKKYTVEMAHLLTISVKAGQIIKKGQQIGTVGGLSTSYSLSGGYDTCAFGAHVHYAISSGYHFSEKGRAGWNAFLANTQPTGDSKVSSLENRRNWTWTTR